MLPSSNDYGHDRFVWRGGCRMRTGMTRSIMPAERETNADFERRMDVLAEQLSSMDGIITVEFIFERRAGHIAQCLFEVAMEPRAIAVIEDIRPAGGRFGTPRGGQMRMPSRMPQC